MKLTYIGIGGYIEDCPVYKDEKGTLVIDLNAYGGKYPGLNYLTGNDIEGEPDYSYDKPETIEFIPYRKTTTGEKIKFFDRTTYTYFKDPVTFYAPRE